MPSCDTANNRSGVAYKFYASRLTDGYKRVVINEALQFGIRKG